jgi:hypothetical protein
MPTTAQSLCEACARDEIPSLPVLADYFGKAIFSPDPQEDVMIIFGVYQGMCKTGVSAKLLHNCMLSNRLNELVHAKHRHRTSGYWAMFQAKELDLSDPCPVGCLSKDQWMEIYDDDHCPHCNTPGYLTEKKELRVPSGKQHFGCTDCCQPEDDEDEDEDEAEDDDAD